MSKLKPRAFKDPKLAVPYSEAEELISAYLNSLPHGGLKEYAETGEPGLSYTALVTLKNGKSQRPSPLAVQRILRTLGFETEVVKKKEPVKGAEAGATKPVTTHQFTFTDAKGLAAFKEAYQSHVHPDDEPASPAPTGK
ncbi:hypothetical protein [Hymenobacter jeollabukensis]|uniref:Uncharacterized protein n=1 Tax=Hymenobacter jeollabukensis TaxID=2025313 RepID=A0A5R8WIT8_9BACT|nr:hypothetical protein [Hymenobacter jeollabukensis]TLM88799.1 hypothetical protein FDY95_23480 [Hymenobacter jeollabukensis]